MCFFIIFIFILFYRSCWLELADLCVAEKQALPTWQEVTLSTGAKDITMELEGAKIMYACFLVHAYLEKHCGDLAMQVRNTLFSRSCSNRLLIPPSLFSNVSVGAAVCRIACYAQLLSCTHSGSPRILCGLIC